MLTESMVTEGAVISLPSFHPDGRSDFRVTAITKDYNGTYVTLDPINPDGHYVQGPGVRTMQDTLRNGRIFT